MRRSLQRALSRVTFNFERSEGKGAVGSWEETVGISKDDRWWEVRSSEMLQARGGYGVQQKRYVI
jgi:hypothetical protein